MEKQSEQLAAQSATAPQSVDDLVDPVERIKIEAGEEHDESTLSATSLVVNTSQLSEQSHEQEQEESSIDSIDTHSTTVSSDEILGNNLADAVQPHDKPLEQVVPDSEQANLAQSQAHEGPGLLEWISTNGFLHKVATKARSSVDQMITTLDPGMKEFLCECDYLSVVCVKRQLCFLMQFLVAM